VSGARIDTLQIAADPERWREFGFDVDAAGVCRLGATTLRITSAEGRQGIVSWTLIGSAGEGPVDGLSTVRLEAAAPASTPAEHPNSALTIDHVVVTTPDFERTIEAVGAAGMRLRRTREAPNGTRQAFFRHGEAILEVVGRRERGEGPAVFWGVVATVLDLDVAARVAGQHLGSANDAVQPGRRIATAAREAGLGLRLALITREGAGSRPPA